MPNNDLMNTLSMLEGNGVAAPSPQAQPQATPALTREEMLAILQRTPYGHPSFQTNRMTPQGMNRAGVPYSDQNPLTGRGFGSYQEWAATQMPEAFANSRTGRGEMQMPAPQMPGANPPQTMSGYGDLVRQFIGRR